MVFAFPLLLCLAQDPVPAAVEFTREVRPLLARRCFNCHGPEPESREAEMRLDVRDSAVAVRDGEYAVIVPGNAADSELWFRITDPLDRMPPEEAGPALTEAEIDVLTRWINQGAEYRPHWSFVPPTKAPAPAVEPLSVDVEIGMRDWSQSPIDALVLARLRQAGLEPAVEADRRTLIRRASLDLTGLPPTPEQVQEFLADERPDAWEHLLDRLMASPHFGERWAAVWLDLARYADSKGYGSDPLREIWRYRDWVIDAFNADLPYDRFTLEQMAGDLLPDATMETRLATAFHRNSMTNTEGGTDDEEFRVAAVKERAALTMQVWMGLTFGCAECHTHKFDPITHEDYYSMFAVFNQTADRDANDDSPKIATPTRAQQAASDRLSAELASLKERMQRSRPDPVAQAQWEADRRARMEAWQTLEARAFHSEHGAHYRQAEDLSWHLEGAAPDRDTIEMHFDPLAEPTSALRIEALASADLPGGGPGASPGNGNFVVSEVEVQAVPALAEVPRARFLRLSLPGERRFLSLAEVMVFAGEDNLAPVGTARQSSTNYEGDAARAIDGNADGRYEESQSVTHSAREDDPWWELDLGCSAAIDRIVVWNRTDGRLHQRLAGLRGELLDEDRQLVWSTWQAQASASPVTWQPAEGRLLRIRSAAADFEQDDYRALHAIDGLLPGGWAIGGQQGRDHQLVLSFAEAVPAGVALRLRLRQQYGASHVLGHLRVSAYAQSEVPAPLPSEVRLGLVQDRAQRDAATLRLLRDHYAGIDPLVAALRSEQQRLEAEYKALAVAQTPVLVALPDAEKRSTFVLNKGNFLLPAQEVQARAPEAFSAFGAPVRDRLELAQWLTHPDNPLTARVAVNRWWGRLFGRGLVLTEEDFGAQGALPTHPQLLDWLAVEYVEGGWSLKRWLKTVMSSATYRQSSLHPGDKLAKDPDNLLLSRGPRFRLNAEAVRDQALALSGLLTREIGGPSVYPPQPDGLWQAAFNGERNWATSSGADRYRRGLYTFLRRSTPYPSMVVFDAPSRETCTVRRIRTNTPLQAFVTLNDPVFVECAQALARKILRHGSTLGPRRDDQLGADGRDRARLQRGLEWCLGRPASDAQVRVLEDLLSQQRRHFAAQPHPALALATQPHGPLNEGEDPAEFAAWTVVANVLLNLDAVLTKE